MDTFSKDFLKFFCRPTNQYICKDAYISRHFRSPSEYPGITGDKENCEISVQRGSRVDLFVYQRAARCSLEIFADEPRSLREPAMGSEGNEKKAL